MDNASHPTSNFDGLPLDAAHNYTLNLTTTSTPVEGTLPDCGDDFWRLSSLFPSSPLPVDGPALDSSLAPWGAIDSLVQHSSGGIYGTIESSYISPTPQGPLFGGNQSSREPQRSSPAPPSDCSTLPLLLDQSPESPFRFDSIHSARSRSLDASHVDFDNGEDFAQMLMEAADDDYDDDRDDEATRYELRPAPRFKALASGSSWLDHDQSGDYDPCARPSYPISRPAKRRRRTMLDDDEGDGERSHGHKKARTYYAARRNGDCFMVTLHLNSVGGRELLSKYPDSCPLHYEERWNFLDDEDVLSDHSSSDDFIRRTHRLRSNRHSFRASCEVDKNIGLGHPTARGCKACFQVGQPCPMLESGGTYPCYLCIEDDCSCELLIEPIKKRSCEQCKKQRQRCSFHDSNDHTGPCEGCQIAGCRCVAGPAIDRTRTRIGDDGKPATVHEKEPHFTRAPAQRQERKANFVTTQGRYLTCTRCRQEGLRCGLSKTNPNLPCQHCASASASCHLRDRTEPTAVRAVSVSSPNTPDAPQSGFGVLDHDAASLFRSMAVASASTFRHSKKRTDSNRDSGVCFVNRGPLLGERTTIHTRLEHPLRFNSTSQCRWCVDPFYGLFGRGENEPVEVRIWLDGKGCTEISKHMPVGRNQGSNMCFACTMGRIKIITCGGHRLLPLPRCSIADNDICAALEVLEASEVGSDRKMALGRFCSICPSLATESCCTGKIDGVKEVGCGLQFCDTCAVLFDALHNQDLHRMIKAIHGDDEESFPRGLRADYMLFTEDGFLVKQVLED